MCIRDRNTLSQHFDDPEWTKTREELKAVHGCVLTPTDTFTIRLMDNFVHFGMHGKHFCSVFEIMGPSLLDLIQHFEDHGQGIPIEIVKVITRQVLIGLDYMHRICKIIHTDLKPENVMLHLEPAELEHLIENLKVYKKKPLSMKYLKKVQSANSKSKKKKKKKSTLR
eukprot:TRINITY_DN32310_c0_g1_i1.p1 TRINITY_DN32310_c0_g1~~TRINITY_DN32310_c0_g1_i1.p1  ORF type:complete len:188 (-),score=40.12 TRINITY_DN32310_c0_g1_i1:3-506(-)